MNTRLNGTTYEDLACKYLEGKGHYIIDRNFSCDIGELDIISLRDGVYHFIEVKHRDDFQFGSSNEAVTMEKLKKVYRVAAVFLRSKNFPMDLPCTVDVILVQDEEVEYVQNCYGVM